MTETNKSTDIAEEIKTLAITSGVTNERLLALASSQQKLTESVATLVQSNHESALRHSNFEQKVINIMESMGSIKTDISTCNQNIKKNSQEISLIRTSIAVNQHTVSIHWKMIAGAVSIAIAAFGAGCAWIKSGS